MHDLWFWAAALIAAALVGMSKGGVPVVGMLGVPVLALVINPVAAAGLLLPVYVVSDVFGLWAYRRHYDRRVLAIVLPGAVAGIGIGWATASLVPEAAVTFLVGLIGFAFALNILARRPAVAEPRRAEVVPGLFWGALAGFTSFVSHAGAPPWQVYTLPLGLSKAVFAGTTTIAFAVINAVKLMPYYALGQLNIGNLKIAAVLALPSVVAVFAGVRLVRLMPERLFFRLVTWALLMISVKLIWDGVSKLA
ncbi:sulfite exporter TauE/SafE family protein [Tabrizicola sp. YIM 78059]|uniref:sulfite exporter TauE/SafE family protein n=1 Tax=Tabrizicola sp. YIM 78059 TaxID=2529861 RepID=UPI0010AA1EBA|nr:sulfite exporter TauE/SafE family protein [Tabrizicola sp. YIM 78059]